MTILRPVKLAWRTAFIAAVFFVSLCLQGCERLQHGGRSAASVFGDPLVVELVRAAESGDEPEMARLTQRGANINYAADKDGMTPLVWVMQSKNRDGVRNLLELGADPNQKLLNGDSATWLAAGGTEPEMLELLLQHHGDPNIMDKDETTALMEAVGNFQEKNIDLLLQHGADINHAREVGDWSAARAAAALGRFDLVAHLLEKGYSHNLDTLAMRVQIREVPPDSEAQKWKDRVIKMLKARGVNYPVKKLRSLNHQEAPDPK